MLEGLQNKFKRLRAAELVYLATKPWNALAIETARQQAVKETKRRFGPNRG